MHIQKISIKNFRLLQEIELCLEKKTTVIVGRNNSGKTSLTELFRRLLSDSLPKFKLEDFSLAAHEGFWNAFQSWKEKSEDDEVRSLLPIIEANLVIDYADSIDDWGQLSDFVIDLNPDCTEALICIRYELENGKINRFFSGIDPQGLSKSDFFKKIKDSIPTQYKASLQAVDPNDVSNRKNLDFSKLRKLLQSGFINAQRGLDDTTHTDKGVLCKIIESLFNTAISEAADPQDRGVAETLESAVQNIQSNLDSDFQKELSKLLPALKEFGYPGLRDPGLSTETTLDVQRLLANHTKVRYHGVNGVSLPEAYNGLGARNLIFILLQILEFFKAFQVRKEMAEVHLVFIEEPEAHLHPQMQEVFIRKIEEIAIFFANKYNNGQP